ncbi:unnamed protein product [Adineta steineri]|uniref:Dynein axonemal intermediate chain 4 n=2 Tax=Adineta steineri TaxID=433720 RepID=A0A813NVF0_9BILA|nr:unnamed protein product [Adineta steineri]CAF0967225.1 unnamed protein product [Adineta steineri]
MSCGRNRRRSKLSSTLHGSSTANRQSIEKSHQFSSSIKSNHSGKLLKEISRENTTNCDRFRVLDDKGNDVTPRRITDYIRLNIKKHNEEEKPITETGNTRVIENQEKSMSDKSIVSTMNLTTATSNIGRTNTLFSIGEKTTLDIGTRIILESEHLFNKTQNERTSHHNNENQEFQATFLPGFGLQCINDVLADTIVLSETETMFILNLNSIVVTQNDHEEYNRIDERNKIYMNLCKNQRGNDLYIERGMQTFNNPPKHEHTVTDSIFIRSQASWANTWDIHDSTIESSQYEGKVYRQYVIHNNENLNDNRIKFDVNHNSNTKQTIVSTQSSQNSSTLISQESLVKMTPSKTNCFELNDNNKNKLPDIDVDAFIMERILNLNIYHQKHTVYQGFDHQDNYGSEYLQDRKDSFLIMNTNLKLERLWQYTSYLTHDRNVSCLCWNKQNHNLLAVGYGYFQYNDDKQGLVCCWNAKNLEFPERHYQTNASVTSLSFSIKHPNLLAVGLFNGNICVFDLNENNTFPIVDTNKYDKKHTNPVWQIEWNERDRSSEIDNSEILISISSDGRIIRWTLRKEFEATDLMHLKPYHSLQMACQILNNNDGNFSNSVGGLCFDIRANDKTIYLCGTDEGVIHRCSMIYNEKYLESYIGHIGPVYKVHWSPFVENIFLSASADWTIRLWMIGYNQSCMTFSSTNSKIFFDAIWSPKSSTMFYCVTENTIEIWDLSKSLYNVYSFFLLFLLLINARLDPIYVANSPHQLTLTSIAYAIDSDCIAVGTSNGTVWIYHLGNLSSSANANDLLTIVEQTLHSQFDSSEKSDINQELSLTSTPSIEINHN